MDNTVNNIGMTNCRNCGAPLNRYGSCDYCGTVSRNGDIQSYMEITADSIRFGTYSYLRDAKGQIRMRSND